MKLEHGGKFTRSRRVLESEEIMRRPDTNNSIYYKDKGKGAKTVPKGNKFSEGEGVQVEDPKKKNFPGPGAYSTEGKHELTTFCMKAPAFSVCSAGLIK